MWVGGSQQREEAAGGIEKAAQTRVEVGRDPEPWMDGGGKREGIGKMSESMISRMIS